MAQLILDTATPFAKGSLICPVTNKVIGNGLFTRQQGIRCVKPFNSNTLNIPFNLRDSTISFRLVGDDMTITDKTFNQAMLFALYSGTNRLFSIFNANGALATIFKNQNNIEDSFGIGLTYSQSKNGVFTVALSNNIKVFFNNSLIFTYNSYGYNNLYPNLNIKFCSFDGSTARRARYCQGIRLHQGILTATEIANEYEYFQNLQSPYKPVYRNYQPKPNQVAKEKLVFNSIRAVGQTIIDEASGNNIALTTVSGLIENIDGGFRVLQTTNLGAVNGNAQFTPNKSHSIAVRTNRLGYLTYNNLYFSGKNLSGTAFGYFNIYNGGNPTVWVLINGTTYGLCNAINLAVWRSLVFVRNEKSIKLYGDGVLLGENTLSDADNAERGVMLPYMNKGNRLRDISIYNAPLTPEEALAYHNQFSYVTLHETFENYAVGDIYGDPYLTNARPVVSELTTAQYGYEVGKKYLASSGATVKFAYIKQYKAFGTYRNYHVFDSFTGVIQIVYVSTNRNNPTATTVNGYYLEINGTNRTIAIKRSGATQLLISSNNVFTFAQLTKIEVTRTVDGVQTLIVNDVTIGSTAADLTWLTSENMRIPSQYTSTFEIEQIVK